LNLPEGVAVDGSGNLYIADTDNSRIRRVGSASILTISNLSPTAVTAGGPAFTLTVTGSGFVNLSTVEWNGAAVTTSYVSASQLSASIPASLIASQGSTSVTVLNPGGSTSNVVMLIINPPPQPPMISGLSPSAVTAGGPVFTLTVNGSGFVNGSTVEWKGAPVATTYINAGQLTAAIPASLIASAGNVSITVNTIGAETSNAVTFTISPPSPAVSGLAIITTLAGNGTDAESGDCGLASVAALDGVQDVAVDGSGNVFISEEYSGRVRKISPSGIITTVVGTNIAPCSGESAPVGYLTHPRGLAVDAAGNLFIADAADYRVA
jgi:hypothetical protein